MLDRETILRALRRLAELLRDRNVDGEICLLGGTVMVLAFQARPSTRDVHAIFQPAAIVRELSRHVAAELDLPADWLNDGAKGFVSARHETTPGDLPQFPGLRVVMPTPEYMLAMKCMASRVAAGPNDHGDFADIRCEPAGIACGGCSIRDEQPDVSSVPGGVPRRVSARAPDRDASGGTFPTRAGLGGR